MAAGARRLSVTLAAGATNENILAGTSIEFPGMAAQVEIFGTIAAAATTNVPLVDVQFGTDLVGESMEIPVEIATGEGPRVPDHLLVVDALAPSDRLIVRFRNVDTAAATGTFLVRVQPV